SRVESNLTPGAPKELRRGVFSAAGRSSDAPGLTMVTFVKTGGHVMRNRQKTIRFARKRSAFISYPSSPGNDQRSTMGLDNHSLFQPDILLPVQYQQSRRNRYLLMPEQQLALAILEDAVACYRKHQFDQTAKGRALFVAAQEWVMSPDENRVFSFENICAVLDLDATYIRDGLGRCQARLPVPHKNKSSIYRLPRRPKAQGRPGSRAHSARTQGQV
ncbi:MAG: hypothetical protein ACREQW_13480, partial [Candidatus Binatia bacterium]